MLALKKIPFFRKLKNSVSSVTWIKSMFLQCHKHIKWWSVLLVRHLTDKEDTSQLPLNRTERLCFSWLMDGCVSQFSIIMTKYLR
jgi:hypothetical protein